MTSFLLNMLSESRARNSSCR